MDRQFGKLIYNIRLRMSALETLRLKFIETNGCVRVVTPDGYGYTNFYLNLLKPYMITTDMKWRTKDVMLINIKKHRVDLKCNLVDYDDKNKKCEILFRVFDDGKVDIMKMDKGKKYKKKGNIRYVLIADWDQMTNPHSFRNWSHKSKMRSIDDIVDMVKSQKA